MAEKLKREFIELLEKDTEFRYTVAGYLGLSEILRRLDSIEANILKLWENQNKLWENQNRIWEEVKTLRINQEKMYRYMDRAFRELRRTLGVAFEDSVAALIEFMLEEMGYPEAQVSRKYIVHEGEVLDINIFCEKPLVVGEATVSIKTREEADREIEKILERVKIVEKKYGRKPYITILFTANATPEIVEYIKSISEKHGIRLVLGRELEIFST